MWIYLAWKCHSKDWLSWECISSVTLRTLVEYLSQGKLYVGCFKFLFLCLQFTNKEWIHWNPKPPHSTPIKAEPRSEGALSLPMTWLCISWPALYSPWPVSNKPFPSKFPNGYCWRVSCNGNKNHKAGSSCNLGLERGEVHGKLTGDQGVLRHF